MWRFFSFGWLEVYFCPLSLASLTWGFSPTFWVAELPLLIGQLKLHVHVFFMINSNFEMVESVSFHGTHCPFWLSALHYAQGMWPQAFRYISPAATSWPQRVSRSSARRMLPSDSQRWVEHVGTISRRYVKTNSSEMYKRKRKDWKVKNHHIYKTISIETSFPIYGWVLPRVSAVSHGFPMVFPWIPRNGMVPSPSQVPTAHGSRPATCGRPGWWLGFGALRGGDGSLLPLPLRGWEASKRALIWFEKWKMMGGSLCIQNLT